MILKTNQREQVMPLPVVLVSTVSKDGIRNIAPWSNITPILRPFDDIVLASWIKRDTLDNIRETGEFVINVPPVDLADAVMICSKNYPPEVDEFEQAGLKPRPSKKVKAPGIEGCLAWVECMLVEEISRKNYSLVIGKVVNLDVDDYYFNKYGEMDYEKAKPLSVMLGDQGMWFTRPVFAGRYAGYAEMFLNKKDEAPTITGENG
ncbi:flavin reductase-like protein [Thermoanaerobacter kivui]|uniref:Flavin reductase-like protein n=1 Tax=Thermoanaerobacter kivui TaxID=2325 RepID=A0A097APK4_THEKI|nr:flavin reductase family protein [Thermoanaerobacter kivui]AIS51722.1 flavin reductase-like protein [Thermoanaerobacter kivui]